MSNKRKLKKINSSAQKQAPKPPEDSTKRILSANSIKLGGTTLDSEEALKRLPKLLGNTIRVLLALCGVPLIVFGFLAWLYPPIHDPITEQILNFQLSSQSERATDLLNQRNFAAAIPEFEKIVHEYHEKLPTGCCAEADKLISLAHAYSAVNDLGKAEEDIKRAISLLQINNQELLARAEYEYGRILILQGSYEKAQTQLRSSLKLSAARNMNGSEVSATLTELGIAETHLGQFKEARSSLNQALALNPSLVKRADIFYSLGNLDLRQGHHELARNEYAESLKNLDATNNEGSGKLAFMCLMQITQLSNWSASNIKPYEGMRQDIESAEKAGALAPADAAVAKVILSTSVQKRPTADAELAFRKLIKIIENGDGDKTILAGAHSGLADALFDKAKRQEGSLQDAQSEYEKAIELFQKTDVANPQFINAYFDLALVYSAEKKFDEALLKCKDGLSKFHSIYGNENKNLENRGLSVLTQIESDRKVSSSKNK